MTATLDSRINRLKIKSKICAVSRSCFLPVFFANRHTLPLLGHAATLQQKTKHLNPACNLTLHPQPCQVYRFSLKHSVNVLVRGYNNSQDFQAQSV
jgi:hypothetical protein